MGSNHRCIIWYKDTNLKAIHNYCVDFSCHSLVVLSDTKIQIWKQFTTKHLTGIVAKGLYYLIQRYKFESNSQRLSTWRLRLTVVLSDTKIQIWKQFATHWWYASLRYSLYYLIQRYKFESNSQPFNISFNAISGCIIWYKDTNLKAIHNAIVMLCFGITLYYLIQRYKFESNSQQKVGYYFLNHLNYK